MGSLPRPLPNPAVLPSPYGSTSVPPPSTTQSESPSLFLPEKTPYPKYTSPTPSSSFTQPLKKRNKTTAGQNTESRPMELLSPSPQLQPATLPPPSSMSTPRTRARTYPAAAPNNNNRTVKGVTAEDASATKKRKRDQGQEEVVDSPARRPVHPPVQIGGDRQARENPRDLFEAALRTFDGRGGLVFGVMNLYDRFH
ncbi:hypothetical protein BKA61DRAFT_664456 [Leptodontidium sp. MPI-SDFR-AT-0119]|nr:hypothetical protein BKA61DRAFT_664456 [Leptodontidium sp. MPI-SDFR-AT-0119]